MRCHGIATLWDSVLILPSATWPHRIFLQLSKYWVCTVQCAAAGWRSWDGLCGKTLSDWVTSWHVLSVSECPSARLQWLQDLIICKQTAWQLWHQSPGSGVVSSLWLEPAQCVSVVSVKCSDPQLAVPPWPPPPPPPPPARASPGSCAPCSPSTRSAWASGPGRASRGSSSRRWRPRTIITTCLLLPAAAGDGPRVPDVQCRGLLVRLPHHLRNGAEPALLHWYLLISTAI